MSLIWKIHRKIRKLLPSVFIKKIRYLFEIYSDSFWCKEVFSTAGEDIALYSLLFRRDQKIGSFTFKKVGFYIDVGAFSPKQFSNTYLFYKKGWRGINIDATPNSMKIFNRIRPRDINIEAAISDTESLLNFYTWGTPTVVNTLSADHANFFTKKIGKEPEIIKVRTRTLESILDEYLPIGQQIDFMSVDVENHDINVLRSNNWKKYRPFLVVVELALEQIEDVISNEITQFMLAQQYHIVSWLYPNIIFERSDLIEY